MKNNIQNELELIVLAKNTSDEIVLKQLSNSAYLSVRRSVAKNKFATTNIIDRLSEDSSLNVSYIANQHNNCTNKRVLISEHPCVICTVDEINYHQSCNSCTSIK
jgi:hypothetical protein